MDRRYTFNDFRPEGRDMLQGCFDYIFIEIRKDCPHDIMVKVDELINHILNKYRECHGKIPDIDTMMICPYLAIFVNRGGEMRFSIGVCFTDSLPYGESMDENMNHGSITIDSGEGCYQSFRNYFMKQLGKWLFEGKGTEGNRVVNGKSDFDKREKNHG